MRGLGILLMMLVVQIGHSQDVHFSHFYHTPMQLNPALTGHFNGNVRLGGNYRNQWQAITRPYRTISGWADTRVAWLSNTDAAFGMVFLNDQAGDGQLTTNKGFISGAIHHTFSRKLSVSIGGGFGFVQKRIDFSKLTFDAQWTPRGFDLSQPTQELLGQQQLFYTDYNVGVVATIRANRDFSWYAGVALRHVSRPTETFYNALNQIGTRPVVQAGGLFRLNDSWHFEPAAMYMRQRGAQEFMMGTHVGYTLPQLLEEDPPTILLAGLWWRGTGNAIPTLGLEYQRIRGMLSYDLQIGQLQTASNTRGGMELSVVYILSWDDGPRQIVIPCYRF